MSNDLTRSPLIIDTAATIFATGIRYHIKSIRWVSEAASAGNNVVVTEGDDRKIWESTAAGANHLDKDILSDRLYNGLKVATIDSGVLYIDIE